MEKVISVVRSSNSLNAAAVASRDFLSQSSGAIVITGVPHVDDSLFTTLKGLPGLSFDRCGKCTVAHNDVDSYRLSFTYGKGERTQGYLLHIGELVAGILGMVFLYTKLAEHGAWLDAVFNSSPLSEL